MGTADKAKKVSKTVNKRTTSQVADNKVVAALIKTVKELDQTVKDEAEAAHTAAELSKRVAEEAAAAALAAQNSAASSASAADDANDANKKFWYVIAAVVLLGAWGFWSGGQRDNRLETLATGSCEDRVSARTAIRDLISTAVGDTDFDGKPDTTSPGLGAIFSSAQFNALEPEDKAMWQLVLTGLDTGGDTSESTTDRLLNYREQIIVPTCR